MCIAAIAIGQSERFPWVLLSNRDEFFDRGAQAMDWWRPKEDGPRILSGRDLTAGGTWLGLNEIGQLALLTNVREPGVSLPSASSRGEIVADWLSGQCSTARLQELTAAPRNGFNLLTANLASRPRAVPDSSRATWLSNRPSQQMATLGTGLYGLSNAALDTPWPKLQTLKQSLHKALQRCEDRHTLVEQGFAALADRTHVPEHLLVSTGLPRDREIQLSSVFVRIAGGSPEKDYGTRCSTAVVVEYAGTDRWVHITERSFDRRGEPIGEVGFRLRLNAL